jgi:hypothetical protein
MFEQAFVPRIQHVVKILIRDVEGLAARVTLPALVSSACFINSCSRDCKSSFNDRPEMRDAFSRTPSRSPIS